MTTVEEIVGQRPPTLRERAAAALRLQREQEEVERSQTVAALHDELWDFLRGELGATDGELAEVQFDVAYPNPHTPAVLTTLDNVRIRARYEKRKLLTRQSSQFEQEDIYEDYPVFDVSVEPNSWKRIKNLTDLARVAGIQPA